MAGKGTKTIKAAGFLLGTLPGFILTALLSIVLICILAYNIVVNTPLLDRIARKALSGLVEGKLDFSDVDVSLVKDFPMVSLRVDSLLVTYPHERYDSLALPGDGGRGTAADTLLSAARLDLRADARAFLKDSRIDADYLRLDSPRVFLRRFNADESNWYVIKSMRPNPDKPKKFKLAQADFSELLLHGGSRIEFSDMGSEMDVVIDCDSLIARGSYVPGQDSIGLDLSLSVRDLSVQDILSSIGKKAGESLEGISTDALICLDARTVGILVPRSLPNLPPSTLHLDIPESRVSWEGRFKDATLVFCADAVNDDANVKDVAVNELILKGDGLDLSATAKIGDLLGKDPRFIADAKGWTALQKLGNYLPASLRKSFSGRGTVEIDIKGNLKSSQLRLEKIAGADVSGHISGRSDVRLNLPKAGVDCFLRKPDVSLATMKSAADSKERAIGCTIKADSVDFDLGDNVCAIGSGVLLFAQNSQKPISEGSSWHPMVGKASADRLLLRTADSLVVGFRGTENKFTVVSYDVQGKSTPYLRLESGNRGLFMKNSSMMVAARQADIVASAEVATPDSLRRRRRIRQSGADSSFVLPDYLSEKEFRSSDIRLSSNASVRSMLSKWNPSLSLRAVSGLVATPAFPLRSRFSGLALSLKDDKITVDSVHVTSGTSDLSASFTLEGLKRQLSRGRGMIRLKGDIDSDRINANEILAALEKGRESRKDDPVEGVPIDNIDAEEYDSKVAVDSIDTNEAHLGYSLIVVPANVNADLCLSVGSLDYSSLVFKGVHSDAQMKERCLSLKDTRAVTDFGEFALDAFYSTKTKQDLAVGFGLTLGEVTAEDVIALFPAVGEVVPMLSSFQGRLDCEMAATSQIDTNMNFILPSIDGMFKIHGSNLILEDLGSLKKIARTLRFKDQISGRVDDMTVNGIVSDNMLEVFPFILDIDRYTVALNGTQSLNGEFNYHASIIRSPLPIKLGINIYGPSFDDWNYRICSPKYRTTRIPLFSDELDNMQVNLVSSIRNVFSRGVDRVFQESRGIQDSLSRRRQELSLDESEDILSKTDQAALESLMIEKEIEEESAALSEEIDRIIAEML